MVKEEFPYLSKVSSPADVKAMDADQLNGLVADIRKALLLKLSRHGGHVGPNLGMVEATIALHRVFNSPADKLVWDVSHQSYTHKMLTGLDTALLNSLKADHQIVVTIEDGQLDGGFGEKVARYYGPTAVRVLNYGLKKEFVDRYDYAAILSQNRLTAPQITADVAALLAK